MSAGKEETEIITSLNIRPIVKLNHLYLAKNCDNC